MTRLNGYYLHDITLHFTQTWFHKEGGVGWQSQDLSESKRDFFDCLQNHFKKLLKQHSLSQLCVKINGQN